MKNAEPVELSSHESQPSAGGGVADCAHALVEAGWAQRDQFLQEDALMRLRHCFEARQARGEFSAAGIGSDSNRRYRPDLRGDSTCWLAEPLQSSERELIRSLEQLRLEVNRQGLLGLWEIEAHYAHYAPGAGFARHEDRPMGSHRRVVSFALYLNAEWHKGDGGELRLYDGNRVMSEIEPVGGRLVCFLTANREHEVLAAIRERASLAGWFLSRS